ncbi:MAG: histidine kinase [Anaerocolumna sp.]
MNKVFHKQIFVKIAIILMLVAFLIAVCYLINSNRKIQESYQSSFVEITERTSSEFNSLIQDMNSISISIASNADVRRAFKAASDASITDTKIYSMINNALLSLFVPSDSVRFRINIYNNNGNFISSGIPYNKNAAINYLSSKEFLDWYNNIKFNQNGVYISPLSYDAWTSNNTLFLSLYRELSYYQYAIHKDGIIEIQCPYSQFDQILSGNNQDIKTYLLDSGFRILYCSGEYAKQDIPHYINLYSSQKEKELIYSSKYNNTLVNIIYLNNGWYLMQLQTLSSFSNVFTSSILLVCSITFLCLLICLYIIFRIIKNTTEPLRILTEQVGHISIDTKELNIDTLNYPEEFKSLTIAFDEMLTRLYSSMEETVKSKEHELRANLIALQSQMDPHILFNMLSVIKALSQEGNTHTIQLICNYLSSILRYISNYINRTATVRQEVEHTENYLRLMKIRYEDQFTYEIQIDPSIEAEKLEIPKLVLQPMLENCFQHAFKKILPPWHVSISCYTLHNHYWVISVSDNGLGFDADTQRDINKKIDEFSNNPIGSMESLKIGGMGLMNTLFRLKIKYKEDFFYDIENLEKGGTCISIGGKLNYDEPNNN